MEHAYELDVMPEDLFKQTGELGINGIVFEEKYGGAAMGYVETLLAYETIARVSNALSMTVGASQTLCFDNFRRNATEAQKLDVLAQVLHGRVHRLPRHHRAQRRLRRHEHGDEGRQEGRQVHHQRQQDLHHQRPRGRLHGVLRQDGPRQRAPRHLHLLLLPPRSRRAGPARRSRSGA
ncbi:MAG: acyl-CoA dehydrogenase family protein [Desulfosudis oleivorans]|nr:acyl-CoA dehydrogenase family protein [Desulfosudis oleivorans]